MNGAVLSVNVARVTELPYRGGRTRTGIYKHPVNGPVTAARYGLDGDVQVDRRYHGGPEQAIYLYPHEHYAAWQTWTEMDDPLPFGAFGENLTTAGILETEVHVGDRFRIGSAVVAATKPRMPCFKLGLKFGSQKIVREMHANERCGFYVSVVEDGVIAAGDTIARLSTDPSRPTIVDVFRRKREQA